MYAAIVLAGGGGTRLGGAGKPTLAVGGRPMLHRVLTAVADAAPRIVVGPPELPLPSGVERTQERPPGGGPAAAAAAGLALVPEHVREVALLAADLPFLTGSAVDLLRRGLGPEGAIYVDADGRPQWLCGVWRSDALRARLAGLPDGGAGASLRAAFRGAGVASYAHQSAGPPPWWDCDTTADLRRAESWT